MRLGSGFAALAIGLASCASGTVGGRSGRVEANAAPSPGSSAEAPGAEACRARAEVWLGALSSGSERQPLPPLEAVGDCWLSLGDEESARAFYRRVKGSFGDRVCDEEGAACGVLAAEELRRIDCGAAWLAPSAEAAWRDFLAAVDRGTSVGASALRVAPDVRVGASRDDPLRETCSDQAFAVPSSVRVDRDRIRAAIDASQADWSERSVTVAMRPDDPPWKNLAPGVYRYFRLRACKAVRPVVGAPQPGYFIDIAPVETADTDPPCPAH